MIDCLLMGAGWGHARGAIAKPQAVFRRASCGEVQTGALVYRVQLTIEKPAREMRNVQIPRVCAARSDNVWLFLFEPIDEGFGAAGGFDAEVDGGGGGDAGEGGRVPAGADEEGLAVRAEGGESVDAAVLEGAGK